MVEDYQENYGNGWIKLYRSITSHWLWEDPNKLKWWLTLLIEVNHTPQKFPLGYKVIDIKRGQSCKSLRTWANLFGTGVKSVSSFFKMLQSDGMIMTEVIGKGKQSTTLVTVCNYDTYQSKKVEEETQGKRKGNAKETQGKRKVPTNNNDKNDKNDKNDNKELREKNFREQVAQHTQYSKDTLEAFSDYWTESNPNGKKMKFEMQKTFDIGRRLKTWNRNNFSKHKEESNHIDYDTIDYTKGLLK